MSASQPNILGLKPDKYTKICYIFILIASGFVVVSSLAALIGSYMTIVMGTMFLGLAGLIMCVLGLFVFKEEFSELALSHFKYILLMFISFLVLQLILGPLLSSITVMGPIIMFLISAAQFILFVAGFRTYRAGISASKASITSNLKSIKSVINKSE